VAASTALTDEVIYRVGRWFASNQTGCHFAAAAVTANANPLVDIDDDPTEQVTAPVIHGHLVVSAENGKLAIVILPRIETEEGLLALITGMRDDGHWTCRATEDSTGIVAEMTWKQPAGEQSSVIGFAPFATMPVTRRSPFVMLAAWPGGRENPFKKKPHEFIGVGDMAHAHSEQAYKKLFKSTGDELKAIKPLPGGEHAVTGSSFRFSARLRGHIPTF
jgi:hypothetical protein